MEQDKYQLHEDNTQLLKSVYEVSKNIKAAFDAAAASDPVGSCMSSIMRVLLLTQEAQMMQEKRLVELEEKAGGKRFPIPPGFR